MQNPTKLMNSKRRVIFQSDRGAFFVKDASGKRIYGIKASFKKTPQGTIKKINTEMANNVPLAIRGMARGAPKGPRPGAMLRKMNTESRKRTFRVTSPGGTVYKTQKQADVAAFLRRLTAPSPKK